MDHKIWALTDRVFAQRYNSRAKQEVFRKLSSFKIDDFKIDRKNDENALRVFVDKTARLYQLSITSDMNEAMEKAS